MLPLMKFPAIRAIQAWSATLKIFRVRLAEPHIAHPVLSRELYLRQIERIAVGCDGLDIHLILT